MKIYYDADCGICNKCKKLVLKLEKTPVPSEGLKVEFLDMHKSIYKDEIKKTIVVAIDDKEFRYGNAIQEIFKKLIFPFNLFAYLPKFILTFFYLILRELRNKFSKNICEI